MQKTMAHILHGKKGIDYCIQKCINNHSKLTVSYCQLGCSSMSWPGSCTWGNLPVQVNFQGHRAGRHWKTAEGCRSWSGPVVMQIRVGTSVVPWTACRKIIC